MVTQSEIIKALKVIQQVCKEATDCMNCPLRTKKDPILRIEEDTTLCRLIQPVSFPRDWELNDQSDWRAFK